MYFFSKVFFIILAKTYKKNRPGARLELVDDDSDVFNISQSFKKIKLKIAYIEAYIRDKIDIKD
jgi:hypothetical protein